MKRSKYQIGGAVAAALFLSFLCMAVIYRKFGMIYAIADDVIMRDIASGAFTGIPDGHLVFIKYVFGWLVSRCYLAVPSLDWYGFFLTGTMFLGLAACLYRGFSMDKTGIWKSVYGIFVLLLFAQTALFHVAQFEWTLCAAFAGASALFFYGTLKNSWENIVVWLLLLLTFCIRSDIFWMLLPGFGVFYLWKHVTYEKSTWLSRGWKIPIKLSHWKFPAAVLASVVAVLLVEQVAYRGTEWEKFEEFQAARSEVYDYYGLPAYEANPEFFDRLGFNETDMRSLRHYALYLVDDLDAEKMTALAEEAKRQSIQGTGTKEKIKKAILLASGQFFSLDYAPMNIYGIMLAAYLLLYCICKKRKGLFWILVLLLLQGGLWFGLGFVGRLPERVAQSMHAADLAMMLVAVCQLGAFPSEKLRKPALGIISVLFSVLAFLNLWGTMKANQEKMVADNNYQLFKAYCRSQEDSLFFIETFMAEPVGGAQLTTEGDFSLNRCLTLGDWYSTSPLDEKRFEALGISSVKDAIFSGQSVYYVARDLETPGFFGDYIEKTQEDKSVSLVDVITIEGRAYYLYRVEGEAVR